MNIKKLTLIATAVSALSLSPLTYARTESTDMSIIGIEPECSYFADLRFHASPFGSKGNIVGDKDNKFEFDKIGWGANAGIGTEITPGFEVSVVASFMTNIGTDSASSTSVSSSPSSSPSSPSPTTTTPASSNASAVKTLEQKHRDAYKKWLHQNSDASKFLTDRLEKSELDKLLAKNYSMRGATILKPTFATASGLSDAAKKLLDADIEILKHYEQLDGRFYNIQDAGKQDYAQRLADLLTKLKNQLGNDVTRENISSLIDVKRADGSYLNDMDKRNALESMYDGVFLATPGAFEGLTEKEIKVIKDYDYKDEKNKQLFTAMRQAARAIGLMGNALAPEQDSKAEIIMNNISLGHISHDATPPGAATDKQVAIKDRTAEDAYALAAEEDTLLEPAVRQLFYYRPFALSLRVLSDMMALADQDVRTQLDRMVANILSTQKGTPQYKKLVKEFDAQLKKADITDRSAEEIIDAIADNIQEQDAKAKAEDKAKDDKKADTKDTNTDKTTASTKKAIDVNLTKFRVGVEGGVRLLDSGSLSLSVIAGVGATAVTGTVAGEDTGYMWGAEVYGGVKGEFAISESMAITARYTYTPALFSGPTLKDDVQKKIKTLGYTDDATMSSLSMHELSAGIRFYF